MNFLELAQMVRQEAGVSGTGPSITTGQTGEMKRIVDWTNNAWRKIQLKKQAWRWMRKSASCQTVIGTGSYPPRTSGGFNLARFDRWYSKTFRIYTTAIGLSDEQFLVPMKWDDFRDTYLVGTRQTGRPLHYSIGPDEAVYLGPVPSAIFTLVGDYKASVQKLVVNADIPEMPEDFHMLIVWGALMSYGRYEAATEIYADAQNNYDEEMVLLENSQLPTVDTYVETLVE